MESMNRRDALVRILGVAGAVGALAVTAACGKGGGDDDDRDGKKKKKKKR